MVGEYLTCKIVARPLFFDLKSPQASRCAAPLEREKGMSKLHFDTILRPWGIGANLGEVGVCKAHMRGYWERKNGSEGGKLLFNRLPGGMYELVDYDGAFELPAAVVSSLRASGFVLDETFDE
jgi:hypothetical protein